MSDTGIQNGADQAMVSVVRCMATTMPAHFRKILGVLARAGNIDAISALNDEGLLTEVSAKSAVLPLPMHAANQRAALDVIRKVLSAGGDLTNDVISLHFERADSADSVRTLAMLGGDPNRWIEYSDTEWVTPLMRQMSAAAASSASDQLQQIPTIMAMIDVLREREAMPLIEANRIDASNMEVRDLFRMAATTAVKGDPDNFYGAVLGQMSDMEWPDSWRKAAGAAIMDAVYLPGAKLNASWRMGLMGNLVAKAEFSDTQALRDMLTGAGSEQSALAKAIHWLADPDTCGTSGVAAARNIVSHGIPIDEITAEIRDDLWLTLGTLLHGAIRQQNAPMLEALLDLDANPDATLRAHPASANNSDVGQSALDLARHYFPEAEQMLHAKKARNAVGRVIKQDAGAKAVTNGGVCP